MSEFGKVVREMAEQKTASVRTDYSCAAHGCPNMGGIGGHYGVNRSGMCYYHSQGPSDQWAEITRRILSDDSMRDPVYRDPKPVDVGDKRTDPKGWAYALKAREERGDRLTLAQREMWRAALQWIRIEADSRDDQT